MEKSYFESLISLYEFKVDDGTNMTQQKIADSGNDVDSDKGLNDLNPEEDFDSGVDSEDLSELDDADYLSDEEASDLSPMIDAIEVSDKQKLLKLFDLFKELLDYSEMFQESLEAIDFNLLEKEKNVKLRRSKDKLESMIEKLENYINEVFYGEKYEKALYVYILLRTELLTNIKLLREILGLNEIQDEKEQKNKIK